MLPRRLVCFCDRDKNNQEQPMFQLVLGIPVVCNEGERVSTKHLLHDWHKADWRVARKFDPGTLTYRLIAAVHSEW